MYGVRDDGLPKGRLTGYKFYEAVMSSQRASDLHDQSLAYSAGRSGSARSSTPRLVKHLEELHNLYKVLDKAREERGGISFESEEAKFIFNAERRIERIEQTQRNDAQ